MLSESELRSTIELSRLILISVNREKGERLLSHVMVCQVFAMDDYLGFVRRSTGLLNSEILSLNKGFV